MFKTLAAPDTPLVHSDFRKYFNENMNESPVLDTLQLGGAAVDVTLAAYETTMLSSTAGGQFNLPDGAYIGQRKLLKADVTGAGTCVPSAAALAKLQRLGASGEAAAALTGLTFDADAEYALIEWTGTKWNTLYATATVAVV